MGLIRHVIGYFKVFYFQRFMKKLLYKKLSLYYYAKYTSDGVCKYWFYIINVM